MNLNLHKQRIITTSLSEDEIIEILKYKPSDSVKRVQNVITIRHPTFYTWTLLFRNEEVVLSVRLKLHFKVLLSIFPFLMVYGSSKEVGWGPSLLFTVIFVLFGLFVNNGLMTEMLNEKEKEITNPNRGN